MWIIAFVVGFVIGIVAAIILVRYRIVGSLVLDFTNPMNDQPFLLELHENVDKVYKRKWICLKISRK